MYMKAIEISKFGPPEVLLSVEHATPVPGAGEILVRVNAAGVARADLLQRQGKYPPPHGASTIPGLDIAGTVAELGSGVTEFRVGDRVCAILAGGGYAQYCAVPVEQALPVPENWTMVEAASLPENLFTAYDNLVTRGALKAGETVLIHGGSSGVGSMGILLARQLGATVVVTAGSDKKCQVCLDLGAEHAINYKTLDFAEEAARWTQGRGVNLILDMVGGGYLERNLKVLATEGRLAVIATQGGASGPLDLGLLLKKRARILGSTMRARTPAEKGMVAAALRRAIWPLLPAKNGIRPVIDSVFELKDASQAHARMESGEVIGKIVLRVG